MFNTNFGWWLDLNRGPLVSEAAAVPTEPQPLPSTYKKCFFQCWNDVFKIPLNKVSTLPRRGHNIREHSFIHSRKAFFIGAEMTFFCYLWDCFWEPSRLTWTEFCCSNTTANKQTADSSLTPNGPKSELAEIEQYTIRKSYGGGNECNFPRFPA